MLTHKYIDKICIGAAVLAALFALLLWLAEDDKPSEAGEPAAYETRLFDDSRVHTVDILVEDWEGFIEEADREEYISCTALIDGEEFRSIGIRAKGNNSLQLTKDYELARYSLKLEFDHFSDGGNYHGLDKLSLDASFQDNSYLKSYTAYDMMRFLGVPTPLTSYTWVTVNGTDWGLFLAVEEPEEAFARRNFGRRHGQLYKPDYHSLNDENADVALRYAGPDPEDYPGIFNHAKFSASEADEKRLLEALRILSTGENLEKAVDVDEVLRYFAVQVFVMNWDSYLGHTGHNYYLYEENGRISMLPWDYNLAFGTYALGMTNPIRDPNILINYPINTPARGKVMMKRPLYHQLMQHDEYFLKYHEYLDALITKYVESGRFETMLRQTEQLIAPYVKKDPTAFCSYQDHRTAVDMLEQVVLLRAESVRAQLDGTIPATLQGQNEYPNERIDASAVRLTDLGDFDDLDEAKARQDEALKRVQQNRAE